MQAGVFEQKVGGLDAYHQARQLSLQPELSHSCQLSQISHPKLVHNTKLICMTYQHGK